MADLDKDYDDIPAGATGDNGDGEAGDDAAASDDEQQDWRFLAAMSTPGKKKSLPKRGEKEYAPEESSAEGTSLDESRAAMYAALAGERKHGEKVHVSALWHSHTGTAKVLSARGPHFRTLGKADHRGVVWLRSEETLYLLERGSMSLYTARGDAQLSLEACYAACMAAMGGHERYLVYAYLKRLGFIVMRVEDTPTSDAMSMAGYGPSVLSRLWNGIAARWARFVTLFSRAIPSFGPLLAPGIWHSYTSVYRALQIIPFYGHIPSPGYSTALASSSSVTTLQPSLDTDPNELRVIFNVWKPRATFKKSAPGEPDFRAVVINARKQNVPTLAQLSALFDTLPVANAAPIAFAPTSMPAQNKRLKEGHRNVVVAVADCGIVSFFNFGDVSFGDETVYKEAPAQVRTLRGSAGEGWKGRGKRR
ncbi:tRNA-splicing endonuclease subunit sen54 N-term-domain-containing protein [Limtongia smithiae]|uniref:tRNA-splicing endonuclease subunit sen54 N-term-domain-containing protein n=1 Tax=Limtongia smithiae TaxID=1125753 RepID=UPI0034CF7C85